MFIFEFFSINLQVEHRFLILVIKTALKLKVVLALFYYFEILIVRYKNEVNCQNLK